MIAGPRPADKAIDDRSSRNLVREPIRSQVFDRAPDREAIRSETFRLFSVTPPML
jgi:hypothetical protein